MGVTTPNATQATRKIAIETPLGPDVLLLKSFSASEQVSRLFEFDLDLLSTDHEINFDDIIGQNVTVRMDLPEGGRRFWNGFISRFVQGVSTSREFAQYRATMVPWLWFLTLKSDCRIFQEKTVPEIVRAVFEELGFSDIEDRTSGGYRTWGYCVQYQETDFNFVSRLMEQEGIYYYFAHEYGKCTIVLCDSRSKHDTFPDYEEVGFSPDTHGSSIQERITEWTLVKKVSSGKFAHTDYNFTKPGTSLLNVEEDRKNHAHSDYEIYDYPGEYAENPEGSRYAKIRMEELALSHELCNGASDARGLCAGHLFTLTRHTRMDQNREYLIMATTCHAAAEDYETSGGQQEQWACSFTVIPSTVQFRPTRATPKPVIDGSQTAIITGPPGEEIYTDEHGRVKVQFHWDRKGSNDENSSCWIRVAQSWAGNGWGGLYIPRIGQEVVVAFLEGDPDQPIIVGAVYHGNNRPPYDLPAEKTKSTLKSNSSKGGGGFNEIRLEDKKGSEEIYIHGEKDWNIKIKNNKTQNIGNNEKLTVGNDREKEVKNNQKETIGVNKAIAVGSNHDEVIEGKQSITVGGNSDVTVGADETLDVLGRRAVTVGTTQVHNIGSQMTVNCPVVNENISGQMTVGIGGTETKTVGGTRNVTSNVENYTVSGLRTITLGSEVRNVGSKQTFLGMDVTTDSGAKFENFAGLKVSNAFALLMELKQINISVTNAAIGYTSFKLDQDGIQVQTKALYVIQ